MGAERYGDGRTPGAASSMRRLVVVAGVGVGGGCGGFFVGGLRRGIELGEVFGGVFGKFLQAAFAAEADFSVGFAGFLVNVDVRLAHRAEIIAGDHAGRERIGAFGFGCRVFGVHGGERREHEGRDGEEDG